MLKLTLEQLYSAVTAARHVEKYEAAKDHLQGWTVPYVIDGAYGETINVAVPCEAVRKEMDSRIAAAHQLLAAMGIELVPGDKERT
jgi:hypothetical protein